MIRLAVVALVVAAGLLCPGGASAEDLPVCPGGVDPTAVTWCRIVQPATKDLEVWYWGGDRPGGRYLLCPDQGVRSSRCIEVKYSKEELALQRALRSAPPIYGPAPVPMPAPGPVDPFGIFTPPPPSVDCYRTAWGMACY